MPQRVRHEDDDDDDDVDIDDDKDEDVADWRVWTFRPIAPLASFQQLNSCLAWDIILGLWHANEQQLTVALEACHTL